MCNQIIACLNQSLTFCNFAFLSLLLLSHFFYPSIVWNLISTFSLIYSLSNIGIVWNGSPFSTIVWFLHLYNWIPCLKRIERSIGLEAIGQTDWQTDRQTQIQIDRQKLVIKKEKQTKRQRDKILVRHKATRKRRQDRKNKEKKGHKER